MERSMDVTRLLYLGDARLHQMVQAIVTVLAVINPVVCGSIFLTLTPKFLPAQRRWAAVRVALSILIILVASALIGLKVLSVFNISLDVFRIVGGMIIAYMGFDMLSGRHTVGQAPPSDDGAATPGDRNCRRSDRRRSYLRGFASCYHDGVASWSQHASDGHPFHGSDCSVYGNAVRADRVEGVLEPLVSGSISAPVNCASCSRSFPEPRPPLRANTGAAGLGSRSASASVR
jgi:MarC family integral membrane protein